MADKNKSIQRLKRQIDAIQPLRQTEEDSEDFTKWYRNTEVTIEKIFGDAGRHLTDFKRVNYSPMVTTHATTDADYRRRYLAGLDEARAVLESFIQEIEEFWEHEEIAASAPSPALSILENICGRFHLVARELRNRREDRPTLEVEDEYDVQDLLRSLLTLHFADIRAEEWTPSYAGGGSRVDFLLKQERIVVEVKKTRKGLEARKLGEELIVDIHRYRSHPDCQVLVCFVYDPDGRIANPRGIENDLNGVREGLTVEVIIAPSGL